MNAEETVERLPPVSTAVIIGIATSLGFLLYFYPGTFWLLVLLLVGYLAFVRWNPALYVFAFVLPLNPLVTGLAVHDLFSAVRLSFFMGVLGRKLMLGASLRHWLISGKIEKRLLVYVFICCFSALVPNHFTLMAGQSLFRLFSYVALFYVVKDSLCSESDVRRLSKSFFWSLAVLSLLAILQVVTGDFGSWWRFLHAGLEDYFEPWQGRASSIFLHVNMLAGYGNMITLLALAAWRLGIAGWTAKICFAFGLLGLLLSQSRGGEIAFCIACLYVLKFTGTRLKLRKVVPAVVLFVALALFVSSSLLIKSGEVDAVERFTHFDSATLLRLNMYAHAVTMFQSAPVLGIGYGNFRAHLTDLMLTPDDPKDVWDAHNLYLKLLAETGLIGFLAFFAFLFTLMRQAKTMALGSEPYRRLVALGAFAACVTLLIHGFVDVMNDVPEFGALLFLLFGMFASQLREQNKANFAPAIAA